MGYDGLLLDMMSCYRIWGLLVELVGYYGIRIVDGLLVDCDGLLVGLMGCCGTWRVDGWIEGLLWDMMGCWWD